MTPLELQARLDGQIAHLRGAAASDNPHDLGSGVSRAWARGWREIDGGSRGPIPRPVPDDFAERAASGVPVKALRDHYRVGNWVIARWIDLIGGKPRAKRASLKEPAPSDFAHYAQIETVEQLLKRYQVGTAKIARWRHELGVPIVRARRVPDDLAQIAPSMTPQQLQTHYDVSRVTLTKWCRQINVKPKPTVRAPAPVAHLGGMGRAKAAPLNQNRDMSLAGQAADFLRRFSPVIRCDKDGHYALEGKFWRRGSTVMTADDVMERARRLGWHPDGWKALAA